MDTTIEKLAETLRMSRTQLMGYINNLDAEVGLGLTTDNLEELNRWQYDVVRGSLDPVYLAKRMKKIKTPGITKGQIYEYNKASGYGDLIQWLSDHDLKTTSIKEIQANLPDELPYFGKQAVASALRDCGYENKVVRLDNGKQGRRWVRVFNPQRVEPTKGTFTEEQERRHKRLIASAKLRENSKPSFM